MLKSINNFSYLDHASCHLSTLLHICSHHLRNVYLLQYWTRLELINSSINHFFYLNHVTYHLSTLLHICPHYCRITCLLKDLIMISINHSNKSLFLPWPCLLSSSHSPSYMSPSFQKNLPFKALNYVRINKSLFLPWPCFLLSFHSPSYLSSSFQKNLPIKTLNNVRIKLQELNCTIYIKS